MTALSAELMVEQEKWTRRQMALAVSKKAYKGGLCVGKIATGTVAPGSTSVTTDIVLGIFAETVDNTSTTTTALVNVDFLKEKTIMWRANDGGISASDIFNPCYIADDATVSKTGTNRTRAGVIMAVETVRGVAYEVGS